jgi:hypothetical protein
VKSYTLPKYALAVITGAALLAACGNNGGSSLAPPGAPAGLAAIPLTAVHSNLSARQPVESGPAKYLRNGFYQYVSNYGNGILEFDYPKGDASIGSIGVSAAGECTRNGKGTFWVASSELEEFKVGGTSPIKVLEPGGGVCAIDPATGDIATSTSGGVVIFRHGRGKGKVYGSNLTEAYFDGYDNSGDLFVDGFNSDGAVVLAELPKRSKTFETIMLANSVLFPGAVQWDGRYLTVGDQESHAIYQYTVSGTTATLEGTVSLNGSSDCVQTWIAKSVVFCPDAGNEDVEVYKYPAGGSPIATLTGSFYLPLAAVQVEK